MSFIVNASLNNFVRLATWLFHRGAQRFDSQSFTEDSQT